MAHMKYFEIIFGKGRVVLQVYCCLLSQQMHHVNERNILIRLVSEVSLFIIKED